MTTDTYLLVTADGWGGALAATRELAGRLTAVVFGPRDLADAVAAGGPDEVRWVQPAVGVPAEAYALALAETLAAAAPVVLVAGSDPAARVLLGAAAARLELPVLPGAVGFGVDGGSVLVRRALVGGETIETCSLPSGVAAVFTGEDVPAASCAPAPVSPLELTPSAITVLGSEPVGVASGLEDAERVVSFGRGVRSKADVALIAALAQACGAELACSMPIADDLGWLDKSRYVGRSGNHIAPNLYLAVGIAGAPQHLEGVRGARVVAAVNSDPDARIFGSADYGIVGDLYEVVPALIEEITR